MSIISTGCSVGKLRHVYAIILELLLPLTAQKKVVVVLCTYAEGASWRRMALILSSRREEDERSNNVDDVVHLRRDDREDQHRWAMLNPRVVAAELATTAMVAAGRRGFVDGTSADCRSLQVARTLVVSPFDMVGEVWGVVGRSTTHNSRQSNLIELGPGCCFWASCRTILNQAESVR